MENKGLLFIPDISGFTRFINETEIDHSRLIIQELLEILINSNQIGLEVSEIEGDAILFYKYGAPPPLEELYRQVEKMFCEFHRSLIAYDHIRYCHCKACNAAINLTLKVITHYGEFTGYNVRNFNKLIGKDIIVAHQLLKNDIDHHEYWLVTKSLLQNDPPAGYAQWMNWNNSAKSTENGEIPFHYTLLSQLKNELLPESLPEVDLSIKTKMLSVSKEYDTDLITLFHATGDFNLRSRWQEGVNKVEEINHWLPRVGMRCRTIKNDGQVIIFSSSYLYHPDKIEFSETEEKNNWLTYYILEKNGENKTRLTLSLFIEKSVIDEVIFRLKTKKKMENNFYKSLQNLNEFLKEYKVPALV